MEIKILDKFNLRENEVYKYDDGVSSFWFERENFRVENIFNIWND